MPESVDSTHVISFSEKSRIIVSTCYLPQGVHTCWVDSLRGPLRLVAQSWYINFHGGGTLPLPVSCLTDGLPELPCQHCAVVRSGWAMFLLLLPIIPSLPVRPLCLRLPHHARMDTPIPEFHNTADPSLDLPCLAPNVLVITAWEMTRVFSEFEIRLSNPFHSYASRAVIHHPNTPWGMAYHLSGCVSIWV